SLPSPQTLRPTCPSNSRRSTLDRRPLLATRAPVEVAPHVPRSAHRCATHQARFSGATVDVDLAAVPILTRSTVHRNRVMLRTDRIDPATTHPVVHQPDEI